MREVYFGYFAVEAEDDLEVILNNAPCEAGHDNDGRVRFVFGGRVHVDVGVGSPRRSRASPRRHSSGARNWLIRSRAACSEAELEGTAKVFEPARRGRRGQSSAE